MELAKDIQHIVDTLLNRKDNTVGIAIILIHDDGMVTRGCAGTGGLQMVALLERTKFDLLKQMDLFDLEKSDEVH
jgi:hypothetical protein